VGSFLGLKPSSFETGERTTAKGHITRQGPGAFASAQPGGVVSAADVAGGRAKFERIVNEEPQAQKKAVVALMREWALAMWHKALDALAVSLIVGERSIDADYEDPTASDLEQHPSGELIGPCVQVKRSAVGVADDRIAGCT